MKKLAVLLGLLVFISVQPVLAKNLSDFLKGKKKHQVYQVTIKSNPAAYVYINGENKGSTNMTLSLRKGRYDLKLVPKKNRRFKELNTQINVSSDQTFQFQLPKKKRKGFFKR